jgi:hypothetical protein
MAGSPALLIGSNTATYSAGTTYFNYLGDDTKDLSVTSDLGKVPYRSAGVLSNLGIRTTTNATTGSSSFTSSKFNNTAGNQTMTIPLGGTNGVGYFEDVTHTDNVAGSGDRWAGKFVTGAGGAVTAVLITCIFTATTNTVTKLVSGYPNVAISTATTGYAPITGSMGNSVALPGTETFTKTRVTHAGTLKNLSQFVAIYSAGTLVTTVRQNAGNTTQTTSIAANGLIEDTTHTTTVAAGDDIDYSLVTSGGSVNLFATTATVEYENTSGYGMAACTIPTALHQTDNTTVYASIGGTLISNTTESASQSKASAAFTFSNLGVLVTGADSPTSNARLRKGAANVNLTITSTASTAGYYEDSSHTDVVVATDLVNYSLFASSVGGTHFADTSQIRISTFVALTGNNVVKSLSETISITESPATARLAAKARTGTETITISDASVATKPVITPLYLQPVFNQWIES